MTENILGWKFKHHHFSSRFYSNSKMNASKLLENLEEIFPYYW